MNQALPVGWTQTDCALTRTIQRADFVEAIALVLKIAQLAETADHHPDIDIRYRKVHLSLSTHSAGHTVTAKDFALAQQINDIQEDYLHTASAELRSRMHQLPSFKPYMKSPDFTSTVYKALFPILGICLMAFLPLRADLNQDLAFTSFKDVDVNGLASGKVLQNRGGLLAFERGITSQALYIIDAAPVDVQKKLATWDPASHPELKVWIHQPLPAKPTPADFAKLSSLPDNGSVNYIIDATAKLDPNNPALQLDKNEAQLAASLKAQNPDKKTLFLNFWSQTLSSRTDNFLAGKYSTANYVIGSGSIRPMDEIIDLIRSDSKIYRDFHPLFAGTPIYASTKIPPASVYFDSFDVEGYGTLGTGAIYQVPDGPALLSADIEFYINSGVYTTVELEKIWPITVNGKSESLVWREDLVSTSNVAYLHGMERLASGMLMLQDVKQCIDAFKAEFK